MKLRRSSLRPRPWAPAAGPLGRVGVVGGVGIGAAVLAVAVAVLVTPRLRAEAEAVRAQAIAAERADREARILAADRARRVEGRDALASPRAVPRPEERDARVVRLLANAAQQGLSAGGLRQTAPESVAAGATGAVQWHTVALPVRGSYAQIRSFLAAALTADPALALDAVKLQREPGSAPDALRAETTWSLAQRRAWTASSEATP